MTSSNENIKNSKSRFLRISSEDKAQSTESNSRFTVNLLTSGGIIDNIKGYIVHSVQVPNVFDNVPTYANVLQLIKTTGSVVYNVTIPNSYYYLNDLITQLQTSINSIIPDSVVVSKTTTSPTETFQLTFTGDEYTLILDNSTIRDRLGLTTDLVCPDGVLSTLQSIPNLIGETEVYIHSRSICPNNLMEPSGSFSVVDKLDLDKAYGQMCYSRYSNEATHFKKYFPYESLKTLRSLRITLRNRTGDILELPDNFKMSMMLMVFYK